MGECGLLTHEEIVSLRHLGRIAHHILKKVRNIIRPNVTTKDIEECFKKYLDSYPDVESAFKGYRGYPGYLCVSVNEEVVHGIPSKERILKEGDVVSIDLGLKRNGLFVDCAYTYPVGRISPVAKKLLKVGINALKAGIQKARAGLRVGDISATIQTVVERAGFSVIRKFVGHGVGKSLHCPPEIPNFGKIGEGEVLKEGMVLAIEPMISVGEYDVEIFSDGWTAVTKDRSLSSHFEHTVAITKRGPWVLT